MEETIILLNPNARGGRVQTLFSQIEAITTRDRPSAKVALTESAAHALSIVRALPKQSRVIVAGGDGSVQGVLTALIAGAHTLGVLPLGSGNDAARALGTFGNHWADTLRHLLRSEESRDLDVGVASFDGKTVNFLVALNAGFDAAVAHRAANSCTWLHGLPKYVLATFRELVALRHWQLHITADSNTTYRGAALFASTLNAPTYGSGMPAVPHARLDDEALNLLIARQFSRFGALVMLPHLLRGTHLGDHRISTHAFHTLRIESETPLPLAADGEYLGTTQLLALSINNLKLRAIK